MIECNLNIVPTLKVRLGYRFNDIIIKNINFDKLFKLFDYNK